MLEFGRVSDESHVLREIFGWLLGIPLLPLFARVEFSEQRLSICFVGFDDTFKLLHEEQLQHPLISVQIHQLEQLPLQDVVIPETQHKHYDNTAGG